jgi:hypothetical protein
MADSKALITMALKIVTTKGVLALWKAAITLGSKLAAQ